ncbi:MAG: OmpA family protein [Saprospiraceae bacterium]|nr:OmpA family protein [Saprospiraceae bacterium]
MRNLALIVFLFFCIYALVARWYFVCQLRQKCDPPPATPVQDTLKDVRLKTLRLTKGDSVLLRDYDHFAFDSASVLPVLTDNNMAFLDTLAAILRADTNLMLTITGLYRPSEKDAKPGFFENIGHARGDAVRRLLMQRGIREGRITLDNTAARNENLQEPLHFELYEDDDRPDEFEKIQFIFTNMTFSDANFAFGSDEFRPGEPFVLYADSVKTYLQLHPDKKMTIIGHTDNIGTNKFNTNLGLRRAESAREYFKELGVVNKIRIESKGEGRPVATNKTEEGRQKNRRVNFVLE